MQQQDFTRWLLDAIGQAPTSFHAARHIGRLLASHGFIRLHESDFWGNPGPGAYYLLRNNSSLAAFTLTENDPAADGLRMAGAHTDSPALKVKPVPLTVNHGCVQLGVEVYGGALLAPWFDRELSLAGRISWEDANGCLQSSLIDFRRPVAVIPSLAIHLDREANKNRTINRQTDIVPVLMQTADNDPDPDFSLILREQLHQQYPEVPCRTILDHDLFFYDPAAPGITGLHGEFITGPRLDNQLSCWTIARALIEAKERRNCLILFYDHEEVGSGSAEGASGPLLDSVLERLLPEPEQRRRTVSRSLFISADNAHAVHPNYADRHDKNHLPLMNCGVVIKLNAGQRYATDALTAGFFRLLCRRQQCAVQDFVMRSDMACGSTIGPLAATRTGVQVIDVGVPTLAMHSIREMAGIKDSHTMYAALQAFFSLAPDDPLWHGWHA